MFICKELSTQYVLLLWKENLLSKAFAEHKDVFPDIYEHMIRVGEVTGSYEKTLHRLSEVEEKNEEKLKIKFLQQ